MHRRAGRSVRRAARAIVALFRDRSPAWTAGALALGTIVLYVCVPFPGEHKWDALMTASALARPHLVDARALFFFAHPLVIPLTYPFAWIAPDALAATELREVVFGGVVVALVFLGARATTGSRLAGLLAALAMVLANFRWRLCTLGEEKEIALAFGGAFLLLYLHHAGGLSLGIASWRARSPRVRKLVLAVLLACAFAVHLVNGILFLVLAGAALFRWRRAALADAAQIAVGALALVGPFFAWLSLGPGHARGLAGVARHFLEYHVSGEFVSVPTSVWERILAAYEGARAWWLGPTTTLTHPWELALVGMVVAALVVRALGAARSAIAPLVIWLALLGAHFFFYEPWDPEAWSNAAPAWIIVLMTGVWAKGRWPRARLFALGAFLVLLCAFNVANYRAQVARNAPAYALMPADSARSPLGVLAKWLDAHLEKDAVLVVSDRHLASYLQIYTRREPIVEPYLDLSRDELVHDAHLSALSLAFYLPPLTAEEIRTTTRPVYLVTRGEHEIADPVELTWDGFRVGRWRPSTDASRPGQAEP